MIGPVESGLDDFVYGADYQHWGNRHELNGRGSQPRLQTDTLTALLQGPIGGIWK